MNFITDLSVFRDLVKCFVLKCVSQMVLMHVLLPLLLIKGPANNLRAQHVHIILCIRSGLTYSLCPHSQHDCYMSCTNVYANIPSEASPMDP